MDGKRDPNSHRKRGPAFLNKLLEPASAIISQACHLSFLKPFVFKDFLCNCQISNTKNAFRLSHDPKPFCHFLSNNLHSIATFTIILTNIAILTILSSSDNNNWSILNKLFSLKSKLSFWLQQKWIKKIWAHKKLIYNKNFSLNTSHHIYILFNMSTKQVYR